MPLEKATAVLSSFQESHPIRYRILYQSLIIIIAFYCAIAISRYGPERDDSNNVPSRWDSNSTTPHICKYGAREDIVDLGPVAVWHIPSLTSSPRKPFSQIYIQQAIIPYPFLCPSTLTFLFALPTFFLGIWKFNALHVKYDEVSVNYYYLPIIILYIDWQHILVSLQIFAPMFILAVTVFAQVMHLGFSTCFPEHYRRHREGRKYLAEEKRVKALRKLSESARDVEVGSEEPEEPEEIMMVKGEVRETITELSENGDTFGVRKGD
jgi:hypothetical protein